MPNNKSIENSLTIAILCHASSGGSGILATELAIGLSQLGHEVHIVGEREPFRLTRAENNLTEPLYKDLGEAPPIQSYWGQLVSLAKRSLAGRFQSLKKPGKSGAIHFHELLSFEYPLFDGSSLPTLRTANTAASLIERLNIDIVNAHYVIPHATSAILARESGIDIKVVTTLHGTDVTRVGCDPAFSYTTKHAIAASDAVTAVCNFLVKEVTRNFGLDRGITVIPNWVDSKRFVRIEDPAKRAEYVQPEEHLCLHVSNFRAVKRSQEAVKIFAKVYEKHPARLILAGDGPEKPECLELAMQLGVSGRVLSIPEVANIESLMGIADTLLLPSEIEASPLVALEAMSSGAIVVASDVGGVSEIVDNGETGFLFAFNDTDSMANQILELISNKEECKKIRENARNKVLSQFTPELMVEKYLQVYQSLLG